MLKACKIFFSRHDIQRDIALYAVIVSIGDTCLHLIFIEVIGKSAKAVALAGQIDCVCAVINCGTEFIRIAGRA